MESEEVTDSGTLLTKEEIEAEFLNHGYRQYHYISPSHDILIKAQDAKTASLKDAEWKQLIKKIVTGELSVAEDAHQFKLNALKAELLQHEQERVERIFKWIEEHSSLPHYHSSGVVNYEMNYTQEERQEFWKQEGIK